MDSDHADLGDLAEPPDFDLGIFALDLMEFDRTVKTAPLTCALAWHTDNQTSQRKLVQALALYKVILACGGNRTGKTWVLRCVIVALALGSDHPHALQFWLHHGVNPELLPKGPGEVCLVALTSGASVEYHRQQVDDLLPAGSQHWNNKTGRGPACVRIDVPGYTKQAIIWFKSEDQGVDAFQGMSLRAVLHDEEGKTPRVWDECSVRLIDQDGWQMMANTPISGKTWVFHRFVRDVPPDVFYTEIWTEDNPYLPKNAVAKLAKQDHAASRLRGAWGDIHGLVYDMWNRDHHIATRERWAQWYPDVEWPIKAPCPLFPSDWPCFRSMDFGSTNPCVCTWMVYDPMGRIIIYRVIHRVGESMAWWADTIKDAERNERIEKGWADHNGAQEMRDLRSMDVVFAKANKDVRPGISAVREYMMVQPSDNRANLFLIQGVSGEFVDEIEQYRYPDRKNDNALPELPVKKNDHVMDTLRYGVVGIRSWLGA